MKQSGKLAVLGAGPIGIEAALRAIEKGYDVAVYEAGGVGQHLRQWEHVPLFTPWKLNRSALGERRLRRQGVELAPAESCPTGGQYRRQYLEPLAQSLSGEVDYHLQTEVLGISRKEKLKGDQIGEEQRASSAFLLRVKGPAGLRFDEADIVVDATGVLSQPNALGPGGLPAIGEEALNGEILRQIPDLHDEVLSAELEGQRILVVGHGYSALTSLDRLQELHQRDPATEILWAFRVDDEPRAVIDEDPLPERARLDRFGNAAARGELEGITPISQAMVRRFEVTNEGLNVDLQCGAETRTIQVDRVIANVGYRPDTSLYRELQVHLCYASDGPMKLAATLLGASSADCLNQPTSGADTLENPEPDFYILGAKSYGRNSNFLLRTGFAQLDTLFGT